MDLRSCTSSDPYARRLWAYLLERFPPAAYTVLVALFAGSAYSLAEMTSGVSVPIAVGVRSGFVVLLVFFHLRIMDEHKDQEADRLAYPDRLLTRGVVTLPMLAKLGWLAVIVQALLAVSISTSAVLAWLAAVLFTALMKVEFGIGTWLNQHMVLYAVSHNPIVGLLAIFLWASSGASWSVEAGLYVLVVSLGSLAFEIGRKVRLPEEEVAGVDSYSSVLGRSRADYLLILIRWVAALVLAGLAVRIGHWPGAILALMLAIASHVLLCNHGRKAKSVEGVATAMLLLDFLLMWGLRW